MPRHPAPTIGQAFNSSFSIEVKTALAANPAIHDGAVMLGRDDQASDYYVRGWSYRLFPNNTATEPMPNRGSAFNSCLNMSLVEEIEEVYLLSNSEMIVFSNGRADIN